MSDDVQPWYRARGAATDSGWYEPSALDAVAETCCCPRRDQPDGSLTFGEFRGLQISYQMWPIAQR